MTFRVDGASAPARVAGARSGVRRVGARPTRVVWATIVSGVLAATVIHGAWAGERSRVISRATVGAALPAATEVSKTEARDCLDAFAKEMRARDSSARCRAVEAVGAYSHAKIADALLSLAKKSSDAALSAECYRQLARQTSSASSVTKAVVRTLVAEAEEDRRAFARGDIGIDMDPRTGDPVVDTPEAKAAILAMEQRGAMLAEAQRCVRRLKEPVPRHAEALLAFLQSPSDTLVVATLETIAEWRIESALPELLELYRMYPAEHQWGTGAVQDRSGTNASAKAKWMARFGHPFKRRPRPEVHGALQRALEAITGQTFESPEQLESHLRERRR